VSASRARLASGCVAACSVDEYQKFLSRARIVFNRSIRGECNKRMFEGASGA